MESYSLSNIICKLPYSKFWYNEIDLSTTLKSKCIAVKINKEKYSIDSNSERFLYTGDLISNPINSGSSWVVINL